MTPLTLQSAEAPAARRCQGVLLSTLGKIYKSRGGAPIPGGERSEPPGCSAERTVRDPAPPDTPREPRDQLFRGLPGDSPEHVPAMSPRLWHRLPHSRWLDTLDAHPAPLDT